MQSTGAKIRRPGAQDETRETYNNHNPSTQTICDKKKAFTFYQIPAVTVLLKTIFATLGMKIAILALHISAQAKQDLIDAFNDRGSGLMILIMTYARARVGYNLQFDDWATPRPQDWVEPLFSMTPRHAPELRTCDSKIWPGAVVVSGSKAEAEAEANPSRSRPFASVVRSREEKRLNQSTPKPRRYPNPKSADKSPSSDKRKRDEEDVSTPNTTPKGKTPVSTALVQDSDDSGLDRALTPAQEHSRGRRRGTDNASRREHAINNRRIIEKLDKLLDGLLQQLGRD
ncbi:MAG: hypothetical protein Q9169_007671 [Polycauliona sp. 2 TL-2023]